MCVLHRRRNTGSRLVKENEPAKERQNEEDIRYAIDRPRCCRLSSGSGPCRRTTPGESNLQHLVHPTELSQLGGTDGALRLRPCAATDPTRRKDWDPACDNGEGGHLVQRPRSGGVRDGREGRGVGPSELLARTAPVAGADHAGREKCRITFQPLSRAERKVHECRNQRRQRIGAAGVLSGPWSGMRVQGLLTQLERAAFCSGRPPSCVV